VSWVWGQAMDFEPRESQWKFVTCNGFGLSVGIIAGEGGTITLKEPGGGGEVKFYLGGIGAGVSVGVKLPKLKIPKINAGKISGGVGSLEAMTSGGRVYMAPTFGGTELTRRDIRGGCCFIEGNAGFAWGGAADGMIFGMNPILLAAAVAAPTLPAVMQHALSTATGLMAWAGVNFGFQAGIGVAGYVGMLYA
jgi:hypothetical protein